MRSLAVKLTLIFIGITLLSIGVIALWVNYSVQSEFISYCQGCGILPPDGSGETGTGAGSQQGHGMMFRMGLAELAFLDAFRNSLWLAALVAVLVAAGLGLLLSQLITKPMRQLALSARRVAEGDFSQRVPKNTNDEVGEVSEAFNTMAEQLEKKEKSKRQLLADIAHELRNPLSVVQGNLEAWRDGVITPTPEQINSVYDETALLSRLITDLRDLSLAETGQLKLYQDNTNIEELISAEIANAQSRCQEKHISISAKLPTGLPSVFIDRDRIRQVLHNLIDNALRYTPPSGSIKIGASSTRQSWVTVTVSDSGSGIDDKDLPYVFDRFYKADRSRYRGYGGAGIGLSMVKQLIELHGGKVWVESQKNKGSTFFFTLPESKA